jgi:hypothetical protein
MLEWIRSNTQGITEAIRQVLYWMMGFELLRNLQGEPWTDVQLALTLSMVSGLLALVTSKTTVAAHKVDARVAEAKEKGRQIGAAVEEARAEGIRQGTDIGIQRGTGY